MMGRVASISTFVKVLDEVPLFDMKMRELDNVSNKDVKFKALEIRKMMTLSVMKAPKTKKLVIFCLHFASLETDIPINLNELFDTLDVPLSAKSSCITLFGDKGYDVKSISSEDSVMKAVRGVMQEFFQEDYEIHQSIISTIVDDLSSKCPEVVSSSPEIIAASLIISYSNKIEKPINKVKLCKELRVNYAGVIKKEKKIRKYF